MKKILFGMWVVSFGLAASAQAADRYFRQGATGNGSGSNWTNAFTSWTTAYNALNRGDTLWVADTTNSIGSVALNKAASGSSPITIKKAIDNARCTALNKTSGECHGPATDWLDGFGDGQAVFGSIDVNTPYHIVDGQTRTETTRMEAPAGYGFRASGIYASGYSGQHNATGSFFSYMDVGGTWNESNTPDCSAPEYLLYFTLQKNVTFSRSCFHNCQGAIAMFHGSDGIVLDHCDFYQAWGKATIASPNDPAANWTIKYCRFWNTSRLNTCPTCQGCGLTCEIGSYAGGGGNTGQALNNMLVYGCIFYNTGTGGRNACIQFGAANDYVAMNNKVYNNTFVGFPEASVVGDIYLYGGSGNEARNNLFYNTGSAKVTANAVSGTVDAASDPFVDYNARDFRLKVAVPVPGGSNLAAPYNIDPSNITRGSDGTWDVGAYEFGGTPLPASNFHPADIGPGGTPDNKIDANEATTFGACWKTNCDPDATMNNAVRAGTLWNASPDGEYTYVSDPLKPCPQCWEVAP